MSRFTDEMYATAATSKAGIVTGEPTSPLRQTWGEVHQVARGMAGALKDAGIGPGDAVGILAGQPVDIAPAVQAIWMRGGSVTMLHQPTPRTDLAHWAEETQLVVDMISARAVVLSSPFEPVGPLLAKRGITVVSVDQLREGAPIDPVQTAEDDTALLQLTSGSTGSPKAVRITHENFHTNSHAMLTAAKYDFDNDVMISWLPLFHDMGMVGFLTTPMHCGCETVNVTPLEFLQSPLLWAELITKYRGTITSAPNFAWSLLARRLQQAEDGAYDLSRMKVAMSGAEPIDPDTMNALLEAGKRFGLPSTALVPAYGMAETTLAISFANVGEGMKVDTVDADLLEGVHSAVPTTKGNLRRLVQLGPLVPNLEGRVVDNEGNVLGTRAVGTIEVRGKAVSPGYITVEGEKPTRDANGWLNTGDIGYFTEDNEIVVCGRAKDVIIMGGRNIYPTDIERAAGTVDGVRPGAAVAVRLDAGDRRESFAVAVETKLHDIPDEVTRIHHEVVHAVFAEVGVRPRTVAVLAPGSIPKTPSGKLRRSSSAALVK
ncbi:fatty acyl-AMP ligase [Hoyosella rhizosphaerae]|uniref:Ligase n=1 Tax=Hoyosella rhizosphaerae TaxID=1755582 RepID=A0A916UCG7_9ACTN|nr:fatty acyl-AMP ligase [Hoyosella rhizosphaerae]MBN4925730.1 fatty acyl-AMP ligase [Hoyosella rhizosphaerae]GGC68395.1 putative ligase [Hoyosella rhizosphaerae]